MKQIKWKVGLQFAVMTAFLVGFSALFAVLLGHTLEFASKDRIDLRQVTFDRLETREFWSPGRHKRKTSLDIVSIPRGDVSGKIAVIDLAPNRQVAVRSASDDEQVRALANSRIPAYRAYRSVGTHLGILLASMAGLGVLIGLLAVYLFKMARVGLRMRAVD